jgi:methylmalonyl-CoA decarboxylase subunit alpha
LASELIVDEITAPNELRSVLIQRYKLYETKDVQFSERKHPVYPV